MLRICEIWHFGEGRGQLFTFDSIVASLVAISLIALAISTYSNLALEDIQSFEYVELSKEAQHVADILLYSPPSPYNWSSGNLSDALVPSITTSDCVVEWRRAVALSRADYNTLRETLGVKDNLYLKLIAFNSSQTYLEAGLSPPSNATLYRLERPVLLNGSISRIQIIIWR
ncbi:MAG: hypothetical protein QXU54_01490 [Candidatus Micrarchaeia archaeon]